MNFDEQEALMNEIREQNEKYLDIFAKDLKDANLKKRTIDNHIFNADFYINDYLLRYELLMMQEGCGIEIHSFLGDFFIRKAMWSTPASVKSTGASIKKFYKSMVEHGYVEQENYKELLDEIKENMSYWQESCEEYNNFGKFGLVEEDR